MEYIKVKFQTWFKEVPLIGLDAMTAMRWFHNIRKPSIDQDGKTTFYAPYNLAILPKKKARVPTGMMLIGSDKQVVLTRVNDGNRPIRIYSGEAMKGEYYEDDIQI